MKKPELLAPAGDFQSLKSAVFAGADAVYFGAKNFNARAKAENFGEDLAGAVAFAHMYGTKVYLTLNTLIENDNAEQLLQTVKNALEAGVDAFIVQDFGVVNLINNSFKNVEIHTSTQMAVNNFLGALQAQKMGAKRVVLSRETNIEDIKLIKQHTSLEIEYFVQGALCVCFSGNCYLSSCLFNKSGNKGECLQPCRLPYKAVLKGKQIAEGYLLSAKDINMSARLKELVEAGVDSFKIEGRLRRPAYVYATTKTYRQIIDNDYVATAQNQTDLKKAFNRGNYTQGYLNGNENIIDYNIQGHIGVKIGRVLNFERGRKFNIIKLETQYEINAGDVLKFVYNNKEVATITAIDIKKVSNNIFNITTTACLPKGAVAHLICDSKKEEADLASKRLLPLKFELIALVNQPLKLNYWLLDENLHTVRVCGCVLGEVCEQAKSQPLTCDSARQSLQKLGETNFYLHDFSVNLNGVFVSKQQLNNLRKTAVENIEKYFENNIKIECNYNYLNNQLIILNNPKKTNKNYSLIFDDKNNNQVDFLVVKPSDYANFDYTKITNKNAFLYIPSFLRNSDIIVIKNILNKFPNLGVYAENLGALEFNKKTILGAKLNIKNIFAINQLLSDNVVAVVTSPELANEEFLKIKNATNVPVIKSDFNDFDLMTLVHCPIKTLFANTCKNCKFETGIEYVMQSGQRLQLKRYKVANCYFTLTKK
ncbi:MAG: U32 family peptidase [Clostridia bacterium]|nr:U32 family peptidase [Clostridia bacterium]